MLRKIFANMVLFIFLAGIDELNAADVLKTDSGNALKNIANINALHTLKSMNILAAL